jgi:excisionase family DNA binding protein
MSESAADDEFLTVDEVATMLKLNPQTVRNMIDRAELPALRVGSRRVRDMRSDLDAFLAKRKRLTNGQRHASRSTTPRQRPPRRFSGRTTPPKPHRHSGIYPTPR